MDESSQNQKTPLLKLESGDFRGPTGSKGPTKSLLKQPKATTFEQASVGHLHLGKKFCLANKLKSQSQMGI